MLSSKQTIFLLGGLGWVFAVAIAVWPQPKYACLYADCPPSVVSSLIGIALLYGLAVIVEEVFTDGV